MAIPVLAGPDVVAVIEFFVSKERAEDAHLVAALAAQLRLRELATLKADFTAMITHELSAPAAAILRLTDMLATGALTPEEQAQTLATIRAEASTLRHLVADVRSTATVERDDFAVAIRPVPLGPILDAAAAVARGLPGEHSVTVESIEARVWAESSRSRWRWHRDPRPARRRSHRMFLMLSPVAPR